MKDIMNVLQQAIDEVKGRMDMKPEVALVLGSGLGNYAKHMDIRQTIDYREIPGFPISTVQGHKGRFVFGYVENVPVVAMEGRVHYYEGYSMEQVVLPICLMKGIGAKVLFLTNASGGIADDLDAGDFMGISDQIASFVPSPLIGPNHEELGERFPDMSKIYDEELLSIIVKEGKKLDIQVKKGVYLQLSGPNFESPAEIRMCKALGADAVGMSTACEAVAAKHMGMKICGISFVANKASGLSHNQLSHEDVQKSASQASKRFEELVDASIMAMGRVIG